MSKTLYPHQNEGSLFLQMFNHCLLASDMGTGKTIQAIDAIKELSLTRVLIICPAVAKFNWQEELKEEGLASTIMGPKNKTPKQDICIGSFEFWSDYQYKLNNYPHHHSHYKTQWDLIIVDESHFLKQPDSKRTKAILGNKGLIHRAERFWAMSGTPAPNHAGELWVYLYTFGKTRLSYEGFIARYCRSHHVGNHHGRIQIEGTRTEFSHELKAMLKSCSLRRLKKDVLDLPPMIHSTYYIEGSSDAEIFKRYPELEAQLKIELEEFKIKYQMNIHSENFLSVLATVAQSLSSLRRYHGLKKVLPTAALIRSELQEQQYKKIIIFGIHTSVLALLQDELKEFFPVAITGKTSDKNRKLAVHRVQNDPNTKVFIGNIKAAGTAITLTAASEVLFIEQDWVPGNNQQAADRAHRIGQELSVNCRHVAIKDSLDSKVVGVIRRKTQELSTFISS